MADIVHIERILIPSIEQSTLLNALDEKRVTQDTIVGMYADCIRAELADCILAEHAVDMSKIDWPLVNAKIAKRWPKGLSRIKTKAWRELHRRTT